MAAASKVPRTNVDQGVLPTNCLLLQVACETATKTGMVMVFGEITTKAKVNYEEIVRKTCKEIGFVSEDVGLDADSCKVRQQSATCGKSTEDYHLYCCMYNSSVCPLCSMLQMTAALASDVSCSLPSPASSTSL